MQNCILDYVCEYFIVNTKYCKNPPIPATPNTVPPPPNTVPLFFPPRGMVLGVIGL